MYGLIGTEGCILIQCNHNEGKLRGQAQQTVGVYIEVPYSYNQGSFYRGKKSKVLIEIAVSHAVGL